MVSEQREIRLIAADLDGTLLNSHHMISDRTVRAIRAAMEQGVQFVIATGKSFDSGAEVAARLGLNGPGVFVQGLVLHNADGSMRSSITLHLDVIRDVVQYAEAHDIPFVAYCGRRILCQSADPRINELVGYGEPHPEMVEAIAEAAAQEPINKIILFHEPETITRLREALSERLNGSATLVQALPQMLEVLPKGTSKGAGLRRLIAEMEIAPEHVLAIGDAENDAEMLRLAGIGAAVANATPAAKAAADVIVASNDEDGVAEAIERFVLNQHD